MGKPRVAVASLGGTITMTSETGSAVAPTLDADSLVAAVPGLNTIASLEAETLAKLPGASLGYQECSNALAWAHTAIDDGAAGVVLVQGTDTLEETAYLLDLSWDRPEPFILTGAMRAPQQEGSDGPANLRSAVATGVEERSRNKGVLVVMNDEIHAAARVGKSDASAVNAFRSPVFGPLGRLVEGQPVYGNRAIRHEPLYLGPKASQAIDSRPRVALLTTHLDDEGELLEQVVQAGYDGAVLSTHGVGHVSAPLAEVVGDTTQHFPVVFASRAEAGTTTLNTYGFTGSESDLISKGAIPAGWLTPVKARLLLWSLVRLHCSQGEITQEFYDRGSIQWEANQL